MLDTKPWKDTFTFPSIFYHVRLSKSMAKVDGHPGGNSGKRVHAAPHRQVAPPDSGLLVRWSMRRTRTRSMSNPVRTVLIRVSDFTADNPVSGSPVRSRSVSFESSAATEERQAASNFSPERSRTRVNEPPHILPLSTSRIPLRQSVQQDASRLAQTQRFENRLVQIVCDPPQTSAVLTDDRTNDHGPSRIWLPTHHVLKG